MKLQKSHRIWRWNEIDGVSIFQWFAEEEKKASLSQLMYGYQYIEGPYVFISIFKRTNHVLISSLFTNVPHFRLFFMKRIISTVSTGCLDQDQAKVGSTKCRNESCIGQGQSCKMSNFWQGTNCETRFHPPLHYWLRGSMGLEKY